MRVNVSGTSRALNGAVGRVDRFPLPVNDVKQQMFREINSYEDDYYVDCPYDDYQDYEDAPDDD